MGADLFKYDVRVRERMIRRGLLNEADVKRHVDALVDAEGMSENVDQPQPALAGGERGRASEDDGEAS
ncbi:MAG: hypothetical protein U0263_04175 [Polyangiaceae bacterium]